MKNSHTVLCFLLMVFSIFLFTGCAVRSPVGGGFMTNTKGPVAAGSSTEYSKIGKSKCRSLNIYVSIGWGECTIEKAKEDGGITKVSFVDHESFQVLGVYGEYTLLVYGD